MNPTSTGKNGVQVPIAIQHRKDGWVPDVGDLSTSYGGTIYATTPGGSKIAYDRSALMYIRNSPLSKGPSLLPSIPGVTAPDEPLARPVQVNSTPERPAGAVAASASVDSAGSAVAEPEDDGVFDMD